MRDQYAGDISDFLKFAFLRAIVPENAQFGVAWYYVEGHDGRSDGRHREYLTEPQWRDFDPVVFDSLESVDVPSVAALESLPIWNGTPIFHRAPVPIDPDARVEWSRKMIRTLDRADILFLDPDNGLPSNDFASEKHASIHEVIQLSGGCRPLVIIHFPLRKNHSSQVDDHHERLRSLNPITVRTHAMVPNPGGGRSPRIRWFTVLNGDEEMRANARRFAGQLSQLRHAGGKIEECFASGHDLKADIQPCN